MEILISGAYNAFDNGYNGAGIYLWSGLILTQSFDRPIYFGSTKDFQQRSEENHLCCLRNNHHQNPLLQNYYNKYGKENLVFFKVEDVEPIREKLLEREQYYLDTERPFVDEKRGFNIAKKAMGCGAETTALEYSFISPNGEIIEGRNIFAFAKKYNLPPSSICFLHHGKIGSCEGWKNNPLKAKHQFIEKEKGKKYILINPEGFQIEIQNLNLFCKNNKLDPGSMRQLLRGKRNHYNGFRRNLPENLCPFIRQKGCFGDYFSVISPEGKIFFGRNIKKFAKDYNLNLNSLMTMIKGKLTYENNLGWTRNEEFYKNNEN